MHSTQAKGGGGVLAVRRRHTAQCPRSGGHARTSSPTCSRPCKACTPSAARWLRRAGSITHCQGPAAGRPCPYVRVSYASASPADLALGMARLAAVLRCALGLQGPGAEDPGASPSITPVPAVDAAPRAASRQGTRPELGADTACAACADGGAAVESNGSAPPPSAFLRAGAAGAAGADAARGGGGEQPCGERAAAAAALQNAATSAIGLGPGSAATVGLGASESAHINAELARDRGTRAARE